MSIPSKTELDDQTAALTIAQAIELKNYLKDKEIAHVQKQGWGTGFDTQKDCVTGRHS